MLITKKKHDAMMREVGRMVVTRDDTIMVLRHQLSTARAEADANKADAEAHRRSKANLALGTAASAAKRKAARKEAVA